MEINIEDILSEIREKIRSSGYTESAAERLLAPPFRFNWYSYRDHIEDLKKHKHIEIKIMPGINWLKNSIKKILRKVMNYCLQTTVEEQNIFNEKVEQVNEDIRNFIEIQRLINGEFHYYIIEKEAVYQKKLIALEQKVELLQRENELLKKKS